MKKRTVILLIIGIATLLVTVIGATFAYFAGEYLSADGKVDFSGRIAGSSNLSLVTLGDTINLNITRDNMLESNVSDSPVASDNGLLQVKLTAGSAEVPIECEYDVYYVYEEDDTTTNYIRSDANKNEFTYQVTKDSVVIIEETNFENTSLVPHKVLTKKIVSNGQEVMDTFSISANFYNIDIDQSSHAGGNWKIRFYIDTNESRCSRYSGVTNYSINTINSEEDIDYLTAKRINEIRTTPNTDVSGKTGNIYYVSNDGDDNNDGLSESTPLKTVSKINEMMDNGLVPEDSAVLFRDGDLFRYNTLTAKSNKVLFGSYGDISKGKPTLTVSPYDGAKEGECVEVKPNIWKYTYDGSDEVFAHEVGTLWFFCENGNNNCTKSMDSIDRKFEYATKITTRQDFDESNIENIIDTLLTHDLETYHSGHAEAGRKTSMNGKVLYLYSEENPADRFDEIEFALGKHIIRNSVTSLYIDNLRLIYTGAHGVSSASATNLVTTNLEVGFIGGSVQNYDDIVAERYGNGIEIYGSVIDMNGDTIREGFIIDNCYVYQVYDAGVTFQYTSKDIAYTDKAIFTNNVFEYSNYHVEYWETTTNLIELKSINEQYESNN